MSYTQALVVAGSYPSAEMRSACSTFTADWAKVKDKENFEFDQLNSA